jgi:radical SAM superfamily enzyme YgiQ (UPF0313 family)
MQENKRILLIYPEMGLSGAYVRHIPLSLLYAAVDSIGAGFAVDIVDTRLFAGDWQKELAAAVTPDTVLAGVSVMTGTPIGSALQITRWLKRHYPQLALVWGGPHASFNPETILSEPVIDFAISGNGSLPLARLAAHLRGDSDALPLDAIRGLVFRHRETGRIVAISPEMHFEPIDYRKIPYDLIREHLGAYGQLDGRERVFSIYSTLGCPYGCTFCSSPALYRELPAKYRLIPPTEVAEHIEMLCREYGASYIYFIDDDSFVDPGHISAIMDEISRRGLPVKLGFRGARIDEVLRMDDAFLTRLAAAGTTILHIGAESGSQRMLDLMGKNITVTDILNANRKLARHPEITAAYNWLIGLPGETLDDLAATRTLILEMLRENPAAIVFPPNKYRPLPGTELYPVAIRHGYTPPARLEGWMDVEVEGDFQPPWYSRQFAAMVNMMQVAAYFIDNKLFTFSLGAGSKNLLIKLVGRCYQPLARLRYRHGITALLIEHWLYIRFSRSFRH